MTRATLQDDAGTAPIDGLPYENIGTFGDTKASAPESDLSVQARGFPWAALLVMALMGFLLIATETMPAGLLPQIASGLNSTEGAAGQFVSAYALGTVIAALPAIAMTRGLRRKPVFIVGILGFLAANLMTVFSTDIVLSLGARLVAGAFSGLLWGMLAGYARRITAPEHAGRALAVASLGTPVGLAVGTPFGAWLGTTLDWRWSFGVLSILTLVTVLLAAILVPDAPGQRAATRVPLVRVFGIPGVAVVLAVIVSWMLGHNIMYTYIGSYFRTASLQLSVDVALVTFGAAAIAGIAITGALIDKGLRRLVLLSVGAVLVAGVIFIVGHAFHWRQSLWRSSCGVSPSAAQRRPAANGDQRGKRRKRRRRQLNARRRVQPRHLRRGRGRRGRDQQLRRTGPAHRPGGACRHRALHRCCRTPHSIPHIADPL